VAGRPRLLGGALAELAPAGCGPSSGGAPLDSSPPKCHPAALLNPGSFHTRGRQPDP
jgi:hypothetical protein